MKNTDLPGSLENKDIKRKKETEIYRAGKKEKEECPKRGG